MSYTSFGKIDMKRTTSPNKLMNISASRSGQKVFDRQTDITRSQQLGAVNKVGASINRMSSLMPVKTASINPLIPQLSITAV